MQDEDLLDYWKSIATAAWRETGQPSTIPGMEGYRTKNSGKGVARPKDESPEAAAQRRLWGKPEPEPDSPAKRRREAIAGCQTHKDWMRLVEATFQDAFGDVPKGREWGTLMKGLKLLDADVPRPREVFLWAITRLGTGTGDGKPVTRVLAYCQELARMGKKRKELRYYESLPLVGDWSG